MNTLSELIKELQALESQGYGENEVHVMMYNGGDDSPAYVHPVKPEFKWSPVVLDWHWAD